MVQASFPEQGLTPTCCPTPGHSRLRPENIGWRMGMVLLCLLYLAAVARGGESVNHARFDQQCTGFEQDPVLRTLGPHGSEPQEASRALATMVPQLTLQGIALATYVPSHEQPRTLESLFGVAQSGQRKIVETPFYQEARAVVLHPGILATVAHALSPDVVDVQVAQHRNVSTVPLKVMRMMVEARVGPDEAMPASIVHINEPYDLALVQSPARAKFVSLPYPAVLSYGTGDLAKPVGGVQAGDCVAAIVPVRQHNVDTGYSRVVLGKVLARVPVAINAMVQTKLNVNMFTTDLAVKPGDSGSPVLALRMGQPVLVGLVSSTVYPTAMFTYVTRIDPLLAFANALQLTASHGQEPPFAQLQEPRPLPRK